MTPKWYDHMKNRQKNEQTSPRVGSLAAGILNDPKSTPAQKSVAGSALTQRPDNPSKGFFRRQLSAKIYARTLEALKKPE